MYRMEDINRHFLNLYNLNDKSLNGIKLNCIDNNIIYYINS